MPLPRIGGSSGSAQVLIADYLKVLYRRRWVALAVLVAVVAGSAAYTYTAVPLYQAQVSVQIDYDPPTVINVVPKVLDEGTYFSNYAQTQYELLQSRTHVKRTVAALKMTERPEFGQGSEDAAVGAVLGSLQIAPVRGTRLVNIRVRWPNPAHAAEIANAHARQYLEQSYDKRINAAKEVASILDQNLSQERKRVEKSDSALQAYREQHGAVSLGDGENIVAAKLIDLNSAVTRARLARIEKEEQYRRLAATKNNLDALDTFPAILENSFIQNLKGDLIKLQRDEAQQSQNLGDDHPKMKEIRQGLETTQRKLDIEIQKVVESVRIAYEAALADEQSYVRELDDQKNEALSLGRRGIEYAALEREAETNQKIFQVLLQRTKEASISGGITSTNVQIIDGARPPNRPIWPNTRSNLLMSLLAGSLLAIGVVFLIELLDDHIKTPADISSQLGQTFLGLVPHMSGQKGRRLSVVQDDTPVAMIEAFRTLRTGVVAATAGAEGTTRVLLVASASEAEGKTLVATNLAIVLAQAQYRVLLVDADLRRPSVNQHFDCRLEPGLSGVLTGAATLRDALQTTNVPGLTVLPGGAPSAQAPELLGTPVFKELLTVLQEHFDWVVIDSPPAVVVADARVVASRGTNVVLVVSAGKTRARAARVAIEEFQRAGAEVLGTVLNRADLEHHPFYYAPYGPGKYGDSLATASNEPQADELTSTGKSI